MLMLMFVALAGTPDVPIDYVPMSILANHLDCSFVLLFIDYVE